jgi:hypothetical protein
MVINEVRFMARTVKGLMRLAARTAGAMEEIVMVVTWGDKIRELQRRQRASALTAPAWPPALPAQLQARFH